MKFHKLCTLVLGVALGALTCLGDLSFDAGRLSARAKATISAENGAVRVRFDDPGWDAGLVVEPPEGRDSWDLSRWEQICVDVTNLSSTRQLRLLIAAWGNNPEGKTREINAGIAVNPGETRTLRLHLPHQWKYGSPQGVPGVRVIDTTRVQKIAFFMQWPFERAAAGLVDCRLSNLRVEGELAPTRQMTADEYIPFIDEYGQFIHGDWPAKVRSAADIRRNHAREMAQLNASRRPAEWNRFGGWKNGPQLEATGNFRTVKHEGKWWLVDPEGRLFFSHGIDVISAYNDPLKVLPGRENWFAKLPPGTTSYFPTELALRQKYGTEAYHAQYFQTVARRLEHWGINTIGDWGRHEIMDLGKTPYTLQLTDYDWRMPRLGESKLKFYDVFDQRYIEKMKTLIPDQAARNPIVLKSLTDPMCIGYFIDNELNFGNRGRMTLVDDVLKCPPTQAAKREFIGDLKLKYITINALNRAWKTSYADWDAMLASTQVPTSDGYREDANVFFLKMVEQYFRLCRDAVKSVAPHRLYLGCRFISTDAPRKALYEASEKYCDVLTVNIYAHSAANFPSPADGFPDMPVLIGEFHFGVLDRGMFSASLCQAGMTQEDRAMAYIRFMQGVLVHPNFIGAHWFQYRDQPLTGRGDGEAYQIGFVDVADTPYEELCQAARKVGEQMYQYRMRGQLVEFD